MAGRFLGSILGVRLAAPLVDRFDVWLVAVEGVWTEMGNYFFLPYRDFDRLIPMSTGTNDDSLITLLVITLAIIVIFPMLMMVFSVPMMGMMGVGLPPIWGIGMVVVWLVILLALGYFVYHAVARGPLGVNDRAIEELRVAYARGDLTYDEFEERRETLER